MKKLLTLTAATLVLSSSFAMAASQPSFNNLDSNADGVITKAEFNNSVNKKAIYKNNKTENKFSHEFDADNQNGRNDD